MRVKAFIASLVLLSTLTNPIFINSQQPEFCNFSEEDEKKPKPTVSQLCYCERLRSKVAPTYEFNNFMYGIKPARKSPNTTRAGVASTRGAVEWTQWTKLKGKLEIPNKDDSNSPEVAGLREQLKKKREEARESVEWYWDKYKNPIRREYWRCHPSGECYEKCKSPDEPGCQLLEGRAWHSITKEENRRTVERKYQQYLDLQNTGDWYRLPKFDWRERGLDVGKVMNQGDCGSCWAFASVSTYLSAWNLEQLRLGEEFMKEMDFERNSWIYQRIPSVQQLLNCMTEEKGDCRAGWYGSAFAFMVNNHVPHVPDKLVWDKEFAAAIEEYTGKKSKCTSIFYNRVVPRGGIHIVPIAGTHARPRLTKESDSWTTAFDRALAWGYVNEPFDEMPSVEKLKSALIEHGPLAASIYSDYCFSLYKGGVFNGRSNTSVNHVVVLIGWDDSKKAWLIKNSWGEDWGEKGFGWVEYGSNNVGLFAAWIQPSPVNKEMPVLE